MSTLFILNKTRFMTSDMLRVLKIAMDMRKLNEDVGILLIQDAVLATIQGQSGKFDDQISKAMKTGIVVYALEPDAAARGLKKERAIQGVQFIDYDQWVDIMVQKYRRIANWA